MMSWPLLKMSSEQICQIIFKSLPYDRTNNARKLLYIVEPYHSPEQWHESCVINSELIYPDGPFDEHHKCWSRRLTIIIVLKQRTIKPQFTASWDPIQPADTTNFMNQLKHLEFLNYESACPKGALNHDDVQFTKTTHWVGNMEFPDYPDYTLPHVLRYLRTFGRLL